MASPGIERIGQVAIVVQDVEKAVAFYRDTLGLRLLFQAPPKLAFFDCAGVRLMLSLPEKPEFDHRFSETPSRRILAPPGSRPHPPFGGCPSRLATTRPRPPGGFVVA